MWLLEQLSAGDGLFGLGFAIRIRSAFDAQRAARAVDEVVERHPALSTTIELLEGRPVQVLGRRARPVLHVEEATGRSDDENRVRVNAFVAEPYDLQRGPLARFLVLDLGPDGAIVVVGVHHIIGDLWSLTTLAAEIAESYGNPSEPARRPSGQRTFASFVQAERDLIESEKGRQSIAFWRDHLPDQWPAIDLAPLSPPLTALGPSGRHVERVPAAELDRWRAFAAEQGADLHDLVLAGYLAVIHRYTGQPELVVGSYRANRSPRDLTVIGCYRNLLAWAVPVDAHSGLAALLHDVAATVAQSRPHQRISLPTVVNELRGSGFVEDIVLPVTYQWMKTTRRVSPDLVTAFGATGGTTDGSSRRALQGDLEVEPYDVGLGTDTDLALEVYEHEDGLDLALVYRSDRLGPAMVERMAGHLHRLLSAGADDPAGAIGLLPMLSASEGAELLASDPPAGVDAAPGATVLDLVDVRLAASPDEVVVREADRSLTAHQLTGESHRLAHWLRDAGVRVGDRVGVHLRPSLEVPAVLLAILRLGATYVALDPDSPAPRVLTLAEDAGVRLVVTADLDPARWTTEAGVGALTWVFLRDAETGRPAAQAEPDARLIEPVSMGADDLVYVSFTSGSTGRPKPVGVTNANAINYLRAMQQRPGFAPGDAILAMASLTFDISFTEFMLPLVAGGTSVVATGPVVEPRILIEQIEKTGVTVVQTTPTIWQRLLDHGLAHRPTLRAWCGGERMSRDLARRLDEACGEAWNLYGPTETTVWCSAWRVVPGEEVALGDPFDNVVFRVLGEGGAPQPTGAVGELQIGGAGVTPGYIGRPLQTEAAFVPDPATGRCFYRTGDLVVRGESGALHFLGRVDDQIKLHGQRIEPGEVEVALRAVPGVRAAAVVVRGDQLVAFIESDGVLDIAAIRNDLIDRLPISLVPGRIEQLDRLPLTTSRKVDRMALRTLPLTPTKVPFEPARPGVEQQLAGLMAAAIGVDRVGRHDDFFDLGGDSLAAAALFADIRELTGRDFPLVALFQRPTVAELAELIGSGWRSSFTSLVEVQPEGDRRPFFSVSPFLISSLSYRLLADCLGSDQPLYAIQPQGLESDDPVHQRIEDMAAHYIDEIRMVQPRGPYRIGGHCAGAWVAFEMALQLQRADEQVELLVLVDSAPPNVEHARPGGPRHLIELLRHYHSSGRLIPALAWQLGLIRHRIVARRSRRPAQRRIVAVRSRHREAHDVYRAEGRFVGSALLLRSQESVDRPDCDWHLSWRDLIDGELLVATVPGTHATLMLEADNTQVMAGQLSALFDQLDRGRPLDVRAVGDPAGAR